MTLIQHDWGSAFGYYLRHDRPDLVHRIVSLDIGGDLDLSFTFKLFSLSYTFFFCLMFALGEPVASFMTLFMNLGMSIVDFGRQERPLGEINGSMFWPYWHLYASHLFNRSDTYLCRFWQQDRWHTLDPSSCPELFLYGARKPIMYHSDRWEKELQKAEKCRVIALDCGHWVTVEKGEQVT